MIKINKKYYWTFFVFLAYGQTVLGQFQPLSTEEAVADIPTASVLNDIIHFIGVALALSFLLFLIVLIISGINFITAGGDEGVLDDGHKMWRVAVFGLLTTLIGYIAINLFKYFI